MKYLKFKLCIKWSLSFIMAAVGFVSFSNSSYANQTTCYLDSGYKIYHIQRNGKLGKRDYSVGTTRNAEYECITDRYYHRIKVNGKWRYVSVKAVSNGTPNAETGSNVHEVIEESDGVNEDISPSERIRSHLSTNMALNENYLLRDSDGNRIASSFGTDINRQNVQVKLSDQGTPIINESGLVNVQYNFINSKGRSETKEAWLVPAAIVNYEQAFSNADSGSLPSGSSANSNLDSGSTSGNAISDSNDAGTENINLPRSGEQIQILDGINNLIPKAEPFLASEPMNGVKPLNSGSEIIATGNRRCDSDSRKCFVEVEFSDDTDGEYVGWIDEQQTSVNPNYHNVALQTRNGTVTGPADPGSDELGNSDGAPTNSDNWYNERFSPEEQASHKTIREFLSTYVPPTAYVTNRGLVRMHNNRRGFCGSYHYATEYNPTVGAADEIQTYANPTTACVVARLTQTWKKYHCPDGGDNNGCRLSTGDISHRTLRKFDGHSSHTDGQCIDLRPIRKSGVGPLDYNSSSYDIDKTRELIKVLKDLGGTNILFNDPKLIKEGLSRRAKGHHNHIHVCFKASNNAVKNSCRSYAPDYEVCPELKSFFDSSLMKDFNK